MQYNKNKEVFMHFLLVGLIAAVGSAVQAATGFGYAMVCMVLWPLIMPLKTASLIEVMTAFFMVSFIALRMRKYIKFKLLVWPLVSSALSSILGVHLLLNTEEGILRRLLGIVLILLAAYFVFFQKKIKIRPSVASGLVAGAISGLCGGLFNIGGPPMVIYFLQVTKDKESYNASLQAYFMLSTVYTFALHIIMGNMGVEVLKIGGIALFGLALGTSVGMALFKRLSIETLKKIVYIFMATCGLYLAIRG